MALAISFHHQVDMEEVDAMLITHFHLDHIAAAPYVATKTPFKVRKMTARA